MSQSTESYVLPVHLEILYWAEQNTYLALPLRKAPPTSLFVDIHLAFVQLQSISTLATPPLSMNGIKKKTFELKPFRKMQVRLNTPFFGRFSITLRHLKNHFNKIPVISHQTAVPELVFTYQWCLQVTAKMNVFVLVKHLSELLLFSKEICVHLLQTIINAWLSFNL